MTNVEMISRTTQSNMMLALAQDQWQQGDWNGLSNINLAMLGGHPQRGKIALFVAAAHHQLGNKDKTLLWSRQALDWGGDMSTLCEILIAGVHHSLGRIAARRGDQQNMLDHFEKSVICPILPAIPYTGQNKAIRELSRLGLLAEAAKLVDQKLRDFQENPPNRDILATHVAILKGEMSILQSELAIAQQRGQLTGISRQAKGAEPPKTLREAERQWLAELKNRATSQLGHELWVLEKSSYKRGGFFVEFGATNGILLSNTYLLEQGFGWNGLCAEPNPVFFEELRKNRLCTVSNACIGATTGEKIEFIFADVFGGMARDVACDQHEERRVAYKSLGNTAEITTISLHDFLKFHKAPTTIDFISIDTEGSEFSILETFPFEQWDVRMLTIEHNFTDQRQKIRSLLEAQGYLCQEAQWDDWYYKPVL